MNKTLKKKSIIIIFCSLVFLGFANYSFAGTIDKIYKYAKGIDNQGVKINFAIFEGNLTVVVKDESITGFAWGEKIGWINLSPSGGGVLNNNEGVLSGYATSEYGGLINFEGVSINSSGDFLGYATSEKLGKISFNCINNNSCLLDDFKVKTDWRPVSVRNNTKRPSSANIPLPAEKPTQLNLKPSQEEEINDQKINSNKISTKPEPIPITNLNQYEGAGDVVKYNTDVLKTKGEIKITAPSDMNDSEIILKEKESLTEKEIIKDFVLNKSQDISSVVKEIKKEAVIISNSPAVDLSTKTVTTAGVAGGGTALFSSVLGGTLSFSEIFLNLFRLWSIFISAIGLRKKHKPWGIVYDSVTKQPLDPAYVVLQDKDNKEIFTAITDIDGRFGFLVPSGVYKIYARKNNYSFPSKKLFGKESDELYENLYFGEYLNIEEGKMIIKNIPMDPVRFDWNQFMKRNQKLFKFRPSYYDLFIKISNIIFYFGFILSIFIFFLKEFNYYNLIIFFFYIIFLIFKVIGIKPKSNGKITERNTGRPLSFSVIRVFKKNDNKEFLHKVADEFGRYYCLLPKGEYFISIEKKNQDESYTKVFTSSPFIIKNGILNKNFEI